MCEGASLHRDHAIIHLYYLANFKHMDINKRGKEMHQFIRIVLMH